MISKTPEERQFYEARMKFLNDAEARMIAARMEGISEGRELGELLGQIRVYRQLLGIPESTFADVQQLNAAELKQMVVELQQQLRERG
ncbi:MAG: hypothetical protein R3C49_27495 [Planctomycetaceae bacterium]